MTRQHFRIIAKALASMNVTDEQCDIMVHALSRTNTRFNELTFRKAVRELKHYYMLQNLDENTKEDAMYEDECTLGDNMPEWYAGANM